MTSDPRLRLSPAGQRYSSDLAMWMKSILPNRPSALLPEVRGLGTQVLTPDLLALGDLLPLVVPAVGEHADALAAQRFLGLLGHG